MTTAASDKAPKSKKIDAPVQQRYRLKLDAGTHRRQPQNTGEKKIFDRQGRVVDTVATFSEAEVIQPGQIFVPTEAELKHFGDKFERVGEDGNPILTEDDETFFSDIQQMNRLELKRTLSQLDGNPRDNEPPIENREMKKAAARDRLTRIETLISDARHRGASKPEIDEIANDPRSGDEPGDVQ